MRYLVIAECVDARDGKRFHPGAHFPNPDDDQAARLIKAGCLVEDKKGVTVEISYEAATAKPLTEASKDELVVIAVHEGLLAINPQRTAKPDLFKAIETHRAEVADGLNDKDIDALREIATAEEVPFEDATTDVDLRTSIRAKRAAA